MGAYVCVLCVYVCVYENRNLYVATYEGMSMGYPLVANAFNVTLATSL